MKRVALILTMLGFASTASAQVDQMMPETGGTGGGQYIARCAVGEILTGFELRTGDDVIAARPICAVPESPSSIGPRVPHLVSAGGSGGKLIQLVCPDAAPGITEMRLGSEGEKTIVINNIRLFCGPIAVNQFADGYPTVAYDGPGIGKNGRFFWATQHCPAGLVPVGIHGFSGIWLDSMGFICGALPLAPPAPPKPAAPGKPTLTPVKEGPFAIIVEWQRPVPANYIEWYSIEQVRDKRWVKLPMRIDARSSSARVGYPDVRDAAERQAFRVCAENSAHRACSPETWYYTFATSQPRATAEVSGTIAAVQSAAAAQQGGMVAHRNTAAAREALAIPATTAIAPADLNVLATRGAELAQQDPLASELRNRTTDGALRRGFDIGMGIWQGNSAPGPGKQRVHDALSPQEQPGFDIAAAFSLPRNKYAALANVGAAIGNADPQVGAARNAENDVFFWLGFDIASGIFGDPKAGAQGNTATGPGSLGIRNELNAPAQRGFNAATTLHLGRHYQ